MIKIAIVGVGNIARGIYLPFLSTQTDVEFGYYNRTAEKAEDAAQKFGGAAFASMEELMAWQPDTVFILTRETTRYGSTFVEPQTPLLRKAANRGARSGTCD